MTIPPKLLSAVAAVKRGWYVFPCEGKQPKWKWGERATNSLANVLTWWTAHPDDNIGIACKRSGLVVLDLDNGHAKVRLLGETWTNGPLAFKYVCRVAGQPEPQTYTVATPSGGLHLYFKAPPGVEIGNRALLKANGLMDVRAAGGEYGGYVLGAGSDGYALMLNRQTGGKPDDPTELPSWLIRLLTPPPRQPATMGGSEYDQPDSWDGLRQWLTTVIQGNRNNALHWAAATMFEQGATEEQVCETLLPAVEDLGESAKRTIASARRTVDRT